MTKERGRAIVIGLSVVVAICLLAGTILNGQDTPQYVRSAYFAGPKEVTIKVPGGQVLSVLQVPAGVELSIHVVAEGKNASADFAGDLQLRAMPASRLKEGSLRLQMASAPLDLYLHDVEVTLK